MDQLNLVSSIQVYYLSYIIETINYDFALKEYHIQ